MKTALVVIALLIPSILSAQDITQMDLRLTNDSTEFYRIVTEISNTNPQDASGFVNRGIAYYHLRNYDQALSDFNKAIELVPLICKVQFVPPFAVLRIVPPPPTVQPVLLSVKSTDHNTFVVPLV